jgi:thiamine kinase-like enzyme
MECTHDLIYSLIPEMKGYDLHIEQLKGGITNTLYRVKSPDGRDYVLRLYGQRTELLIDRDIETENLRRLGSSGVTPRLIKYLPDREVTVVEFIPGYVLKNQDFLKQELWESIIRPIKIIHRCMVTLPRIFEPIAEVKRFCEILKEINSHYPEFDIQETIRVLEKISDVAGIPQSAYVPCHNDLLADNFILASDKQRFKEPMYLIDWEYAGMSTPYYEIADMFQEILVPKEVERKLLEIYWEDKDMDHHVYMTDLFKPFPDIYWFL